MTLPEGSSGPPSRLDEGQLRKPSMLLISSITLTAIVGTVLVGPVTPDIVKDFGAPTKAIGLLVAATTAPGILLAPIMGVLADRFGRRQVLVPCLALFGVAGGLSSFAPSFEVLLGLRILQGIGSAALINLAVVIIGDHWAGEERARKIGRNAAILTASVVVAPPIGGLLAGIGGWRLVFAPMWIGVVTAVAVAVSLPKTPKLDVSLTDQLRATRPYLRSPAFLGASAGGFLLFVLIFGLLLTVIPLYLAEEFGASAELRGLVLGLPAITSTVGALNLARWSFRFGSRRVVGVAFGLVGAGFALMASVASLPVIMVAVLVYGLGEGLLIPSLQDAVSGAAPDASRGAVVALFVGCLRAGQTAGPVAAAQIAAGSGPRTAFAAGAMLSVALVAASRWLVHPPAPVLTHDGADAPEQAAAGLRSEARPGPGMLAGPNGPSLP